MTGRQLGRQGFIGNHPKQEITGNSLAKRHHAAATRQRQGRLQMATNFATALGINTKLKHDMAVACLVACFFSKTGQLI